MLSYNPHTKVRVVLFISGIVIYLQFDYLQENNRFLLFESTVTLWRRVYLISTIKHTNLISIKSISSNVLFTIDSSICRRSIHLTLAISSATPSSTPRQKKTERAERLSEIGGECPVCGNLAEETASNGNGNKINCFQYNKFKTVNRQM